VSVFVVVAVLNAGLKQFEGTASELADVRVDAVLPVQVALIWIGHIGADRLAGYGLKFETGFRDTHLGVQPAPVAALGERES
jgi:hypothetical protein